MDAKKLEQIQAVAELSANVVVGFQLVVEQVDKLEVMVKQGTAEEVAEEKAILVKLVDKVNTLLGHVYALNSEKLLAFLGKEVKKVTEGKEAQLMTALVISGRGLGL